MGVEKRWRRNEKFKKFIARVSGSVFLNLITLRWNKLLLVGRGRICSYRTDVVAMEGAERKVVLGSSGEQDARNF